MSREYADSSMKMCLVTSGDAKFPTVLYSIPFYCVAVTMAWRVFMLRMGRQHSDMEGGYEYI